MRSGVERLLLPLAAALGAAAAFAYVRGPLLGSILTVLSPAPLVFLALFLVGSDVSKLVLPQDDAEASSAGVSRAAPVVMLVLDEFRVPTLMDRNHRIDPVRFPNLAKLSRESTWYRNATTVADQTTRAVPALLTVAAAGGRAADPRRPPAQSIHHARRILPDERSGGGD